jgi:hypothetical protein
VVGHPRKLAASHGFVNHPSEAKQRGNRQFSSGELDEPVKEGYGSRGDGSASNVSAGDGDVS